MPTEISLLWAQTRMRTANIIAGSFLLRPSLLTKAFYSQPVHPFFRGINRGGLFFVFHGFLGRGKQRHFSAGGTRKKGSISRSLRRGLYPLRVFFASFFTEFSHPSFYSPGFLFFPWISFPLPNSRARAFSYFASPNFCGEGTKAGRKWATSQ